MKVVVIVLVDVTSGKFVVAVIVQAFGSCATVNFTKSAPMRSALVGVFQMVILQRGIVQRSGGYFFGYEKNETIKKKQK